MTPLSRRDPAGIFLSFSFLHLQLAPTLEPLNLEEPMDTWIFLTVICIVLRAGCRCLAMFSFFKDPSKIWPEGKTDLNSIVLEGKSHQMLLFFFFKFHTSPKNY